MLGLVLTFAACQFKPCSVAMASDAADQTSEVLLLSKIVGKTYKQMNCSTID